MDVRLTRAACPGRTRVRSLSTCGSALALLAVLGLLACARKEAAAPPSPGASATAPRSGMGDSPEPAPAPEATDVASAPGTDTAGKTPPEPGKTPPETGTAPEPGKTRPPTRPAPRPASDTRPSTRPPRSSDQAATTAPSPERDKPVQPAPPPPPRPDGPAPPPPRDDPAPPPPPPDDLPVTATLAPEPAPAPDPRADVEAFYAGLPEESIAFHVPATVPRGQLFTVRLIVEPGKSEAEIERVLVEMARDAGPGEVRTRTARVGDEMQALLSSPTLQIVTRGNDTQLVRRSGVTEWAWDVTATTGGTHRLALTLYAIPQGRGSGLKVKTFEETLAVEVGFADEIKETLSEHWEWMWTFVLGPVGALVWRRHRRLARPPE